MWKRLKDYIKRWRQQTIKLHNYQKVAQFRIRDYHCSLFRLNQSVCMGACYWELGMSMVDVVVVHRKVREWEIETKCYLSWEENRISTKTKLRRIFLSSRNTHLRGFSSLKFLENGRVISVSYRNTHLWVFVSLPSLIQTRPFHFPHSIL